MKITPLTYITPYNSQITHSSQDPHITTQALQHNVLQMLTQIPMYNNSFWCCSYCDPLKAVVNHKFQLKN